MKVKYKTLLDLNLVSPHTILDYQERDDGEVYVIYADRLVDDDGLVDVRVVPYDPVLAVTAQEPVAPELESDVINQMLAQARISQAEVHSADFAAVARDVLSELEADPASFRLTMTELECEMLRKRLVAIIDSAEDGQMF